MKIVRQLSMVVLILLGFTALYSSCYMITDPTGNSLGLPFYVLHNSVFNNYSTLGWILLFTVGISSLGIALLIILKIKIYSFFVMLQGVVLCIFIFVQMLLVGVFFVQYILLGIGIALIVLGFLQTQGRIIIESGKKK
jgi:hypothetical protein